MFAVDGWSLGSVERQNKTKRHQRPSGLDDAVVDGLDGASKANRRAKRRGSSQKQNSRLDPRESYLEDGLSKLKQSSLQKPSLNRSPVKRQKPNMKQNVKQNVEKWPDENQIEEPDKAIVHGNSDLSTLQQKMKAKLAGARFRWINEELYTKPSNLAVKLFQAQPDTFDDYHCGFRQQVTSWPLNPVDTFINKLAESYNSRKGLTVADLGCGDAAIGTRFAQTKGVRVLSYDLVARKSGVVVADIAKLPLADNAVDIAIFCLSLMGTNTTDFLVEAKRVLKPKGGLWIAEIRSRFVDPEAKGFIAALDKLGFRLVSKEENKMFYTFEFVNDRKSISTDIGTVLQPCLYKRR